ncbi:MAG: NRDE family protein [Steroidobacteraceae bacterium]|jgi:uncharacterized protein with NRDE domain|nr:NRDE family protein [Steroidobacteraceae bacterium]
MCLVVLAYDCHPRYRLILAANRDEFHDRPAAPLAWWHDAPGILGGRDLAAGGTWLGLDRRGRLGVVTNFRDPSTYRPAAPSRGALIPRFLRDEAGARDCADRICADSAELSGFSLLLFDGRGLAYAANQPSAEGRPLAPGIYGLSNHALDTPWPKLSLTRERFAAEVAADRLDPGPLLRLLRDRRPAPDEALPDTGIGLERERLLSATFIVSEGYGTRCTTVVLIDREGEVRVEECRYGRSGEPVGRTAVAFRVTAGSA